MIFLNESWEIVSSLAFICWFEGVRVLTPYNPSREGYRVGKRRSCLKHCRNLGGQKVIKKFNIHEGTDVFDVFRRDNFWHRGSVNSVTNWPSATCFFLKTFFCKNQSPQPNSRIFSLQGRVWRGRLYWVPVVQLAFLVFFVFAFVLDMQ